VIRQPRQLSWLLSPREVPEASDARYAHKCTAYSAPYGCGIVDHHALYTVAEFDVTVLSVVVGWLDDGG
jgi:hypothetical protein